MNEGIVPLTVVDDEVGASYWSTTNRVFLPLFLGSGCVVYENAGLVLGSLMLSDVPIERITYGQRKHPSVRPHPSGFGHP